MHPYNSELFLTTSEVAELLGVHPSTVKRWTDAGELPSDKTGGGHRRIYLAHVLELARERGVPTFLDPFAPFEGHVWLAVRDAVRHDDFRKVVSLALGWLVRGYPRRITDLVLHLASRSELPFSRVADGALHAFMAEVGMAWREGRLRIGEEHMASQAVMEALVRRSAELTRGREGHLGNLGHDGQDGPGVEGEFFPRLVGAEPVGAGPAVGDAARARGVALVGATAGDHHHLGAFCVRLILEARGWEVHYLGADTPAEEFASLQRSHGAELVCISFSPPASAAHMRRSLDVLAEFHRAEHPYDLVFGGQAGPALDGERVEGPFRSFAILPSLEELVMHLDRLDARAVDGGTGDRGATLRESA
jgi:excisionase family DNA binding protein